MTSRRLLPAIINTVFPDALVHSGQTGWLPGGNDGRRRLFPCFRLMQDGMQGRAVEPRLFLQPTTARRDAKVGYEKCQHWLPCNAGICSSSNAGLNRPDQIWRIEDLMSTQSLRNNDHRPPGLSPHFCTARVAITPAPNATPSEAPQNISRPRKSMIICPKAPGFS